MTRESFNKLYSHDWPGNIRELKNVIERAAILCDSNKVEVEHILFSFEIGKNIKNMKSRLHLSGDKGESLKSRVNDFERRIIIDTLKISDSIRKASRTLGMSHTALLNKIKKYNIPPETK